MSVRGRHGLGVVGGSTLPGGSQPPAIEGMEMIALLSAWRPSYELSIRNLTEFPIGEKRLQTLNYRILVFNMLLTLWAFRNKFKELQ